MTLPDFNRFLSAITRERLPDRVPNAEVGVDVAIMEAFLGRPIRNVRGHVDFWREAGYDYTVVQVRGQPLPDHPYQQIIGQPDRNAEAGPESRSTFAGGAVVDDAAFESYPWIGPDKVYYGDVELMKDCLPDGMKIVISHGPLFSGVWRAMGLENFSIACDENPELVRAVVDKMGGLTVNIVENLAQRDWVGAIWFGDDIAYTTGLMASPDFFRTHIFPHYKKIGDICAKHKKPFIYHSDGDLTEAMEDLVDCGVQAIHPNEPTSTDIAERKRAYGHRMSFIGNIDVGLLARGTCEEVVEATKFLIDNVAPGGGFALGSGNSIASYCSLDNYRAMLDTVRQFGDVY